MSYSWMGGGRYEQPREENWYDVRQVCLNGHQTTNYAQSQPGSRKKFCDRCGAATIMACQSCSAPIQGFHHMSGVIYVDRSEPPKYCVECGKPFPWQTAAIENLEEILRDDGISAADLEIVERSLADIVSDTPKTDSAVLKFKRILGKLSKPAYDLAIKVTTDLAAESAKKALGLG